MFVLFVYFWNKIMFTIYPVLDMNVFLKGFLETIDTEWNNRLNMAK